MKVETVERNGQIFYRKKSEWLGKVCTFLLGFLLGAVAVIGFIGVVIWV